MRGLSLLCIQLGFHPDYPDVSTAATTYNDGLYYVASFLQEHLAGATVDVCQMMWGERPADFPLESYDYILISALATQFWSNQDALRDVARRKSPRARVIMGGPHATFAPHEALGIADFVILGEGEIPALDLIERLERGEGHEQVPNLCWRRADGRLAFSRFERYDRIDNAIAPNLLARAPDLHWATVSMSRGCPYDCSFCYAIRILGRRFRPKDASAIVAELDGIHAQTGCRRFYVTDLNFTTRGDFCRDVAAALTGRDYHFIAMSRIEAIDDVPLIRELARAGFKEYCLGVESESPAVLEAFSKRVDSSRQTERLHRFAENDIYIHSAIIFGLEEQDEAAIKRTARWCADARIVHPTFVCLAEYPFQRLLYGSRQDIEDHRIILGIPTYQHYSFVGIFPRHMRPSRLQRAIAAAYAAFFERAFELETRPQRRMRLKSYARSVARGLPGMERHARLLEELEAPYYTAAGVLREDLLRRDFDHRHGPLRERLGASEHLDPGFAAAFAR